MTNSIAQQPPESRLRRWWRSLYGVVKAMETSGYERMADRTDYLEERVRRLEAAHMPPKDE